MLGEVETSESGPFHRSATSALTARFGGIADSLCSLRVARGLVNLADAVLRQCIRPLIGACWAPGHHGYQRAFELISGQASNRPFGSPVFACGGKTDPPLLSHPLADLGG